MKIRTVFLIGSLILNIVIGYSVVWGKSGLLAYNDLQRLHAKLSLQETEVDGINMALSQEIRLLQTDEKYLEKVIRKRLNFVRQNELIYIFPQAEASR